MIRNRRLAGRLRPRTGRGVGWMASVATAVAASAVAAEPPAAPAGATAVLGVARRDLTSSSTCVAFAPDGRLLAVGEQAGKIWLWDVQADKPVAQFPWTGPAVQFVQFVAGGKQLVAAGGAVIEVFDVAGRSRAHTINLDANITAMAVSPDGAHAAVAGFSRPSLIDLGTGKEVRPLESVKSRPYGLAFSPDGKTLASATGSRRLHLLKVADGQDAVEPIALDQLPRSVAFAADGSTVLVGLYGGTIDAFDVRTRAKVSRPGDGAERSLNHIALSADGTLMAALSTGQLAMWRREEQGRRVTFTSPLRVYQPQGIRSLDISPDGTMVAAARRTSGHGFDLWRFADGRRPGSRDGHVGIVRRLACSADGRTLVSWGEDEQVIAWDLATRRGRYLGQAGWEAYSSDLAVCDGAVWLASFITAIGHVTRIDLADGKVTPLSVPQGQMRGVAFLPHRSEALTVGWPAGLTLRGLDSWATPREVSPPPTAPGAIALTPDGRRAALLEPGALTLWRTGDAWERVGRVALEAAQVNAANLAASADGALAAVATSDGRLRVIELPTGGPAHRPRRRPRRELPDGRRGRRPGCRRDRRGHHRPLADAQTPAARENRAGWAHARGPLARLGRRGRCARLSGVPPACRRRR